MAQFGELYAPCPVRQYVPYVRRISVDGLSDIGVLSGLNAAAVLTICRELATVRATAASGIKVPLTTDPQTTVSFALTPRGLP